MARSHTPFYRSVASWAWAPTWWSSVTTASSLPTTRLCCRAGQRMGLRCCLCFNTLRSDCPRCTVQWPAPGACAPQDDVELMTKEEVLDFKPTPRTDRRDTF